MLLFETLQSFRQSASKCALCRICLHSVMEISTIIASTLRQADGHQAALLLLPWNSFLSQYF